MLARRVRGTCPIPAKQKICDIAAILSGRASAVFPQLTRRDSHPIFNKSGTSGHFRPVSVSCSHQFAGILPGIHEIRQPGLCRLRAVLAPHADGIGPSPPSCTVRAPLRAYGATRLPAGHGGRGHSPQKTLRQFWDAGWTPARPRQNV